MHAPALASASALAPAPAPAPALHLHVRLLLLVLLCLILMLSLPVLYACLDFTSENSREFGAKGYNVRSSFKPSEDWRGGAKFDATTSNQQHYRAHGGAPAKAASRPYDETHDLLIGRDPVSFQTESGTQYGNKGYGVRESYKPKDSLKNSDKLDGTTTMKQDYKRHGKSRSNRMKGNSACSSMFVHAV
jgi:hypothetical protein